MRWLRAGFLPLSLLILVTAAMIVPLPYVRERPGSTLSLAACVDVDHEKATPVAGDYLLMTISVQRATTVDAVKALFEHDTLLVPRQSVIPPGTDTGTYFENQRDEFALSADRAAAVGLAAAGLPADISGDGAAVVQTLPDTPAHGVLEPGDIIVAVNDETVSDESDLRTIVEELPTDQPATLTVKRRAEVVEVPVTPAEMEGRTVLGVHPATDNPRVSLPVGVDVAGGPIGGPSAGLMIALTVYDQVLPGVDVARGRTVAGTGSIDADGRVGPIGGAGLKVLAAHRAGADVFLSPAGNYADAQSFLPAGSSMDVVSVETFEDAREALGEAPADDTTEVNAQSADCPHDAGT